MVVTPPPSLEARAGSHAILTTAVGTRYLIKLPQSSPLAENKQTKNDNEVA